MKYLYYVDGEHVKRVEMDNIAYLYIQNTRKMFMDEYIIHEVYVNTIDDKSIKVFSNSKITCENYANYFLEIGFIKVWDHISYYYNNKNVNAYKVVFNSNLPFITDRDIYNEE